jgi:hypothetical protein
MNELTDIQKTLIWCSGAMLEFEELGLIRGGPNVSLTPSGVALYDQLDAKGFRPTQEHVREFVARQCTSGGSSKDVECLINLLCYFGVNRERMRRFAAAYQDTAEDSPGDHEH